MILIVPVNESFSYAIFRKYGLDIGWNIHKQTIVIRDKDYELTRDAWAVFGIIDVKRLFYINAEGKIEGRVEVCH